MKVLIIHTRYQLRGGEDSVVENEAVSLQSQGIEVDFLFFDNKGKTLLKLLQLPFNLTSYFKTKEKLSLFQPDVVHIHNLHFSGSAAVIYAIRRAKIPLVMTLHNYRLLCPSGSLFHNGKLFLSSINGGFPWAAVKSGVYQQSQIITFWLALSNYIHQKLGTFKTVDQFILLGNHSKEIFASSALGKYADNMVIKPNFSKNTFTPSVEKNKQLHYLYVGRLTEEKGVLILLQAFAKNKQPLIIVGTGPLQETVKLYASQYKHITFLGEQSLDKIYTLLNDTIALIFPSVWYETFGMVVIEAFSKGVPVITSNLGNMKYLVTHKHNGLTFSAGSSDNLSLTVQYYQNLNSMDKEIYQQNAYFTYRDKYAAEDNMISLIQVYRRAINKHSYHL